MKDGTETLQVTGTGKVQVAPDEAIIDLGVITEAKTAAEAVADNAKRTQAVMDAVSAEPNHGVTTLGLGVSPIYSYDPNTHEGTIVGFRATNGVQVRTKIGYAGQIYDAGVAAGASQSSGIAFRLQNEAPHREEALRLAVVHAHTEAGIVAKAANVQLAGIESIQIDSGGGGIYYRAAALDAKVATPVQPEDKTITASVHLVFGIRPHRGP